MIVSSSPRHQRACRVLVAEIEVRVSGRDGRLDRLRYVTIPFPIPLSLVGSRKEREIGIDGCETEKAIAPLELLINDDERHRQHILLIKPSGNTRRESTWGVSTGSSTSILRNRRRRPRRRCRRQARKTARRFKCEQPFAVTKCSKPSGDSER